MKEATIAVRSNPMDLPPLTDEELVDRTKHGQVSAFAEIIKRYQDKLLRYGRRFLKVPEDAEDAVQEAFINAYKNIAGFRSGQRLSPWLYRIAHNSFVSLIRSRKQAALPFFDPDELFPHPVAPDRTDAEAERVSIRQQLDRGLTSIDLKYHEILVLRYYEDLSYAEIADILRLPVGTVSIRIKRGLAKLANALSSSSTHA